MSNSFKLPQSPIPFLDGNFPVGSEIGGQPIVVKRDPKVLDLGQVVTKYALNTAPENFNVQNLGQKIIIRLFSGLY